MSKNLFKLPNNKLSKARKDIKEETIKPEVNTEAKTITPEEGQEKTEDPENQGNTGNPENQGNSENPENQDNTGNKAKKKKVKEEGTTSNK